MCKRSELLRIDEMFSKRNQNFDSFLADEEKRRSIAKLGRSFY